MRQDSSQYTIGENKIATKIKSEALKTFKKINKFRKYIAAISL
ncbi:hypothetical protein SAMN04488121_1031028 [Chitinophaga filiformis]|uniref:Uncharacterized protein n=1 Tax=Chitinophaga filiformis TaxID=104663 RepID=A0A1G7SVD2_CHIFI|nr:hypothetical protein SAMN04488121_1031028 [Chitinophaga filiformis]